MGPMCSEPERIQAPADVYDGYGIEYEEAPAVAEFHPVGDPEYDPSDQFRTEKRKSGK